MERKNISIPRGYDAPCHNCNDRKVLCHSNCIRYKEFTNKIKAIPRNTINNIGCNYVTGKRYSDGDKLQKRPQK